MLSSPGCYTFWNSLKLSFRPQIQTTCPQKLLPIKTGTKRFLICRKHFVQGGGWPCVWWPICEQASQKGGIKLLCCVDLGRLMGYPLPVVLWVEPDSTVSLYSLVEGGSGLLDQLSLNGQIWVSCHNIRANCMSYLSFLKSANSSKP